MAKHNVGTLLFWAVMLPSVKLSGRNSLLYTKQIFIMVSSGLK